MEIKLFSPTHIKEARELFPEKIGDRAWRNRLWTEDEINACKSIETEAFCRNPDVSYFEERFPGFMDESTFAQTESLRIVELIDEQKPASIRSIGCGFGRKEMYLARKYPHIKFYCDDIAPYVEQLNVVASQLGLANIEFAQSNACRFPQVDLVYCAAVFYCIPSADLSSFFAYVGAQAKPGGTLFLTEVAYLNPYVLLRSQLARLNRSRIVKQTGWRRTLSSIRRHFPDNFRLVDYDFERHMPPARLPAFVRKLSSRSFPLFASRLVLIVQVT